MASKAASTPTASFTAEQILTEQVKIIYRMQIPSAMVTLALSALVALILQGVGPQIWIWLTAQTVLKLATYVEGRWFYDPDAVANDPRAKVRWLCIIEPLNAIGWASLIWVVGADVTPFQLAFIILVLGGVLSGGVTTYGALPIVHAAYLASFGLTNLAAFARMREVLPENPYVQFAPLLVALYCFAVFLNTRASGEAYHRFIKLGFTNAELARNLKREIERVEEARRDAEAANAAKTTFLASASHDLRQPIHGLGLFLALLEGTNLDAQQRAMLSSARNALNASSEMLDTLLDFSRAEAGVITPQIQAFAIDDVINEIESELGHHADRKGLTFRVRECGLTVMADPSLVRLILLNLGSNAINYTPSGGVFFGCRRRGDQLSVEVWDTGIGIAADQHEHIFSDFIQLGNPERDRRKGLGLGLAISRRLARLMGSEVTLASRLGKGSVFRFEIPLAGDGRRTIRPPQAPANPVAPQPTINAAMRPPLDATARYVLVLDDDPTILEGLGSLLVTNGFLVATAETIDEALAQSLVRPPDLLICDLRLREGRIGTEAGRLLRERYDLNLPVLIITGDTHPDRIVHAEREGFKILYKPISPARILEAIRALLHS